MITLEIFTLTINAFRARRTVKIIMTFCKVAKLVYTLQLRLAWRFIRARFVYTFLLIATHPVGAI